MNYGVALMARGDFAQARDCYERAALFTPNYWTLEINRGIVEGSLGNPAAAEAHFRRAVELAPGQPDVHFYFARWLVKAGRGPEAVEHLENGARTEPCRHRGAHASDRSPGGERRRRRRRGARPRDGRRRASKRPGRRLSRGPKPGAARDVRPSGLPESRVWCSASGGNDVESALAYRAALAIDPGYADALNNLGWTLGKLGFFAEAVPVLEKTVALRPDFALARNNLAWVKSKTK